MKKTLLMLMALSTLTFAKLPTYLYKNYKLGAYISNFADLLPVKKEEIKNFILPQNSQAGLLYYKSSKDKNLYYMFNDEQLAGIVRVFKTEDKPDVFFKNTQKDFLGGSVLLMDRNKGKVFLKKFEGEQQKQELLKVFNKTEVQLNTFKVLSAVFEDDETRAIFTYTTEKKKDKGCKICELTDVDKPATKTINTVMVTYIP